MSGPTQADMDALVQQLADLQARLDKQGKIKMQMVLLNLSVLRGRYKNLRVICKNMMEDGSKGRLKIFGQRDRSM